MLEGRDRVGGRSSTAMIADVPVDLGGTFVGPTQDAVLALADELGCRTVPTYDRGKNLIRWHGRGALLPEHHPAAVDDGTVRRLPHPVALRTALPA